MSKSRVPLPVFLDSLLPLKCRSVDSSVRGRVVWFFVANKRMMFFSIANYAKNMPTLWGRQVVESRGPGWVVAGECCPYAGIAAVWRPLAANIRTIEIAAMLKQLEPFVIKTV